MREGKVETEQKLERRWYQYSLRTLLIVMVLLCFLFAWGGYKIRQAERQKEVVAWVREKGGWVIYDYEYDAKGKWIPDAEPPCPDWLRNLIGIDYLYDVDKVSLWADDTPNTFIYTDVKLILTRLHGLRSVKEISFGWVTPSNQKLQELQESLQKLKKSFPECEFSHHLSQSYGPPVRWCRGCNKWHPEDSNPHTAEP